MNKFRYLAPLKFKYISDFRLNKANTIDKSKLIDKTRLIDNEILINKYESLGSLTKSGIIDGFITHEINKNILNEVESVDYILIFDEILPQTDYNLTHKNIEIKNILIQNIENKSNISILKHQIINIIENQNKKVNIYFDLNIDIEYFDILYTLLEKYVDIINSIQIPNKLFRKLVYNNTKLIPILNNINNLIIELDNFDKSDLIYLESLKISSNSIIIIDETGKISFNIFKLLFTCKNYTIINVKTQNIFTNLIETYVVNGKNTNIIINKNEIVEIKSNNNSITNKLDENKLVISTNSDYKNRIFINKIRYNNLYISSLYRIQDSPILFIKE